MKWDRVPSIDSITVKIKSDYMRKCSVFLKTQWRYQSRGLTKQFPQPLHKHVMALSQTAITAAEGKGSKNSNLMLASMGDHGKREISQEDKGKHISSK